MQGVSLYSRGHACAIAAMILIGICLSGRLSATDTAVPELIHIPTGTFITGSDRTEREHAYELDEQGYGHRMTREQHWYEDEGGRQTVKVGAFDIMKTLVTNRDYRRFIEATGHRVPDVDRQTWERYGLIHPYARTRRSLFAITRVCIDIMLCPMAL